MARGTNEVRINLAGLDQIVFLLYPEHKHRAELCVIYNDMWHSILRSQVERPGPKDSHIRMV